MGYLNHSLHLFPEQFCKKLQKMTVLQPVDLLFFGKLMKLKVYLGNSSCVISQGQLQYGYTEVMKKETGLSKINVLHFQTRENNFALLGGNIM